MLPWAGPPPPNATSAPAEHTGRSRRGCPERRPRGAVGEGGGRTLALGSPGRVRFRAQGLRGDRPGGRTSGGAEGGETPR